MKKINPYVIIIVILLIAVAVLGYKQWGGKKNNNDTPQIKNIDVEIFKDDLQIGKADAPVTIVEYFSYLCGYCKLFEDEVKPKILENYIQTGKAKLILRIFPPYELGQAALCANDQGKFLEYHDYLFENNGNIKTTDDLKNFAKNIGLNKSSFNQCMDSLKYESRAKDWYNQGISDLEKAGTPKEKIGTPAFFINGIPVVGAMPYEDFVKAIESELK